MANQLIQKLLDAEQEADAIVRQARNNWVKKLKEAQSTTDEEIQRFRASEEEKFKKQYSESNANAEISNELEDKMREDIELVRQQFKKHREQAVALLISGVVRVDLTLSDVEKRQLKLFHEART